MRDHSQQPRSAMTRAKSDQTGAGAMNSMQSTSARSATAVRTRVRSIVRGGPLARLGHRLARGELLAGTAEAALAAAEGFEGRVEGGRAEVWPQRLGEVELGVGELPQQEVGHALLAARADEEIGLGRIGHG